MTEKRARQRATMARFATIVRGDVGIGPLIGPTWPDSPPGSGADSRAPRARTRGSNRDTLLPKLVSGERRLRGTERLLEATS